MRGHYKCFDLRWKLFITLKKLKEKKLKKHNIRFVFSDKITRYTQYYFQNLLSKSIDYQKHAYGIYTLLVGKKKWAFSQFTKESKLK